MMPGESPEPGTPEPWSAADFRSIASLLRARHGPALTAQRLGLIRSRLQIRLRSRGFASFGLFHERVLRGRSDGPDMQLLIDLSTVNHTSFFREPIPLRFAAERLVERMRVGPARAWTAGCSAGQEPFSLAMMAAELTPSAPPGQLEVWASDLSSEMVQAAAAAIYDARELTEISPERLRRFFLRGRGPRRGLFRVVPEIRRQVAFRHFDLRDADWPVPGEFDVILCRNVLLYFAEAERTDMLDRLAGRLRGGGWLIVGNCEILPNRPRRLEKQAPSIYRKAQTP